MKKFASIFNDVRFERKKRTYPETKVLLDPTCTIEQIMNRAQFGMPIPQRDVSGDLTQQDLDVLGLSGNDLGLMNNMQLIDLKVRAKMRLNAIQASKLKQEQAAQEKALKEGAVNEYIAMQATKSSE